MLWVGQEVQTSPFILNSTTDLCCALLVSTLWMCSEAQHKRDFYHPQREFAKVMFSQVSVCLSMGGGLCLPLGRYPSGQTLPGQTPLARYLPGRHLPPSACWDTHTPLLPSACSDTHILPSAYWDTVNKWVACIPLECILVNNRHIRDVM